MAILRVRPARTGRWLAVAAGLAVLVGAMLMAATLVATPGPWTQGYVSETGTPGRPFAAAYTVGAFGLALGVSLLAARLLPVARVAGVLLAVAALMAGLSAAVPCSTGCPLPPYEAFTAADLVHTGAAVVGLAAVFFAMLAVALAATVPRGCRRWAAGFAVVVFPLAATEGLGMLLVGRGGLTAVVERLLLVVTVCWLVGAAVLTVWGPGGVGWEISRRRHRPDGTS